MTQLNLIWFNENKQKFITSYPTKDLLTVNNCFLNVYTFSRLILNVGSDIEWK